MRLRNVQPDIEGLYYHKYFQHVLLLLLFPSCSDCGYVMSAIEICAPVWTGRREVFLEFLHDPSSFVWFLSHA